jgi:hypothetical protein
MSLGGLLEVLGNEVNSVLAVSLRYLKFSSTMSLQMGLM